MGSDSEYVLQKKYKIVHTSNYNAFLSGDFASNTYKGVTMVMLPGSQMRWAYIQTTNTVDLVIFACFDFCEFVILRLYTTSRIYLFIYLFIYWDIFIQGGLFSSQAIFHICPVEILLYMLYEKQTFNYIIYNTSELYNTDKNAW